MCIMFWDKSFFGFFKSPFCSGFSLHLHKNGTHGKKYHASCKFSKVFFMKLAKADISEWVCLLNGRNQLRRSITNDNKIMYKFNDKSLARYRYKQKQSLWNLWAILVCAILSDQILSVSAPTFLKLVFVIEAPGSHVPVKLWTCVRNSQSSYFCPCLLYPYPKFRPPKWRVLH